jgi:hypothetical protein
MACLFLKLAWFGDFLGAQLWTVWSLLLDESEGNNSRLPPIGYEYSDPRLI